MERKNNLKKYVKKLKKGKQLEQYSINHWANEWNIAKITKRRRNYLDWRNTKDFQRDEVLEYQDGYSLDNFLNKQAEERKPYVKLLINLRFKSYIFRKIY